VLPEKRLMTFGTKGSLSDKPMGTNVTNVNKQHGFSVLPEKRLMTFGTKGSLSDKPRVQMSLM